MFFQNNNQLQHLLLLIILLSINLNLTLLNCSINFEPTFLQKEKTFSSEVPPQLFFSIPLITEDIPYLVKGYYNNRPIQLKCEFIPSSAQNEEMTMKINFDKSHSLEGDQFNLVINGNIRTKDCKIISINQTFSFIYQRGKNEIGILPLKQSKISPTTTLELPIQGNAHLLEEISKNEIKTTIHFENSQDFLIDTSQKGLIQIKPINFWKRVGKHSFQIIFNYIKEEALFFKESKIQFEVQSNEACELKAIHRKIDSEKALFCYDFEFNNLINIESLRNRVHFVPKIDGTWKQTQNKILRYTPKALSLSNCPTQIMVEAGITNPTSQISSLKPFNWVVEKDSYTHIPILETLYLMTKNKSTKIDVKGNSNFLKTYSIPTIESSLYILELELRFNFPLIKSESVNYLKNIQIRPTLPTAELGIPKQSSYRFSPDCKSLIISYQFSKLHLSTLPGVYECIVRCNQFHFKEVPLNLKCDPIKFFIEEVFYE